jgi:N-acetylmuramoyl-L-alanine amidase
VALAALLVHPPAGAVAQQPPPAPTSPPPLFSVVVDPGHGGDDHGAVGATGIEEKALVLGVAQRLQSLAALHGGIRVRLTREDDRSLTLDQRATAANSSPGILFISLHANFSPSPKTAGVEVGTFRDAVPVAPEVTAAARRGGPSPPAAPVSRWGALVRWDQAQAQHADRASVVAQRLVQRFRVTGTVGPRAWYQAPLKPLSAVNMPAVLVELGYLSNADDEAALVSEKRQAVLAQAVLDVVLASIDSGAVVAGAR